MSRLKSLLCVAPLSTCNTQQIPAGTTSDDTGRSSQTLLLVASTSTRNTQHELLHDCIPVAQHLHSVQQKVEWQEFESLLALVAPAYRIPAHEYAEIRAAARGDLQAALLAYRSLAQQIKGR